MQTDPADGDRWLRWHDGYDDPHSPLSRRLAIVQDQVRRALDAAPRGSIRVLSLCAGRGLDLLGVLSDHPRAADVDARLVELDPRLAADAEATAGRVAARVEVAVGDAGTTDACRGAVPADLLLLAGIFGNVADADVRRTAGATAMLCSRGATVIWTRHRRPPDATPAIREWYAAAGVRETAFIAPSGDLISVFAGRFEGTPRPLVPGQRLFTFI